MSEDTYSYDIDDVENDEEIEANIEVAEAEDGDDIDENDDELIENKRCSCRNDSKWCTIINRCSKRYNRCL